MSYFLSFLNNSVIIQLTVFNRLFITIPHDKHILGDKKRNRVTYKPYQDSSLKCMLFIIQQFSLERSLLLMQDGSINAKILCRKIV